MAKKKKKTSKAKKVVKKTKAKAKAAPAKKASASTGGGSSVSLTALENKINSMDERLKNIESKLEVLGGVTREYLEEQFDKLNDFTKERQMMVKILDQHESRINSLEGF